MGCEEGSNVGENVMNFKGGTVYLLNYTSHKLRLASTNVRKKWNNEKESFPVIQGGVGIIIIYYRSGHLTGEVVTLI